MNAVLHQLPPSWIVHNLTANFWQKERNQELAGKEKNNSSFILNFLSKIYVTINPSDDINLDYT